MSLTCAVSTGVVQLVALVADTAEHTKDVLTHAVDTQVAERLTLVDVCNRQEHDIVNSKTQDVRTKAELLSLLG